MSDYIALVTPFFNDEKSIIPFRERLEKSLFETNRPFTVIVVDDCSQDNTLSILSSLMLKLSVLKLKFNLRDQAAIHQELLVLLPYDNYDIVEVSRGKRRESLCF